MIFVKVNERKIEVKGHAESADYGYDIICAGVSTILITHYNLLVKFYSKSFFDCQAEEGFFSLIIKEMKHEIKLIYENIIESLEDLALQYPENIKVERK